MIDRAKAKSALDKLIKKSRVHLYKPIQIAEILYQKRLNPQMDLLNLESYRTKSKKWRDEVSLYLLGRICTSSAKFQDNLFDDNAVPPNVLKVLGDENNRTNGAVEAYIYRMFDNRHSQLSSALKYCYENTKETFNIKTLIDSFWHEAGLRRSLDKIYEIIVYSLFSILVDELELIIKVSINEDKLYVLKEFEDFTKNVMCIEFSKPVYMQSAKVYRVGVTNAADRGLDMYANWGPAIQIKHLALDEVLAENIVDSVSSDKIVIVCKTAEKGLIVSLLTQIGWKSKIQSIITEDDLINWYEKALRGKYSNIIGDKLIECLCEEISAEFPSVNTKNNILSSRKYELIQDDFWQ